MNDSTQKIVESFFKYLSERNLEELIKLFSDNIDWYIPGDESKAPWLGRRNNKQQISEFYKLLWENTEPISVTVDNILIDKDTAIIAGDFSTRMLQTNKTVNSLFFIKITIQNGLISKYRLLEDSLEVSKSLT